MNVNVEDLGLSLDEVAELKRLARQTGKLPPARIEWPAPRPLLPEERALFVPLWPPVYDGPPKSYEEKALRDEADGVLWAREKERISAMLALGVQKITQHASDTRFADPDEPLWVVTCTPTSSRVPDNGQPPVVVRAPDKYVARERWGELIGLVDGLASIDQGAFKIEATPYVEATTNGSAT